MRGPTPLLDCFRRGEVARDARFLAAQGALAPRAYEQLAILALLLEDADFEIRRTAEETLSRIAAAPLAAVLAQPDVPLELKERLAARGITTDQTAGVEIADDPEQPLIDTSEAVAETSSEVLSDVSSCVSFDQPEVVDGSRKSLVHGIAQMSFTERLKAAIKGTRETRAVLIRDTNKTVAAAVLSSPKLTVSEIESFARMANVGEDALRIIGNSRGWTKHYGVVVGLTRNPKTPVAVSMNLMARLNARDMLTLSVDRNVPEAVRSAARKRISAGTTKK